MSAFTFASASRLLKTLGPPPFLPSLPSSPCTKCWMWGSRSLMWCKSIDRCPLCTTFSHPPQGARREGIGLAARHSPTSVPSLSTRQTPLPARFFLISRGPSRSRTFTTSRDGCLGFLGSTMRTARAKCWRRLRSIVSLPWTASTPSSTCLSPSTASMEPTLACSQSPHSSSCARATTGTSPGTSASAPTHPSLAPSISRSSSVTMTNPSSTSFGSTTPFSQTAPRRFRVLRCIPYQSLSATIGRAPNSPTASSTPTRAWSWEWGVKGRMPSQRSSCIVASFSGTMYPAERCSTRTAAQRPLPHRRVQAPARRGQRG
mmetsp:Transcript_29057/g.73155  ORF Transcript_29057/g.73155 Transcript_29057/m.73155 type:complete len:317 (+) Transcript_29057:283-1233(+)